MQPAPGLPGRSSTDPHAVKQLEVIFKMLPNERERHRKVLVLPILLSSRYLESTLRTV